MRIVVLGASLALAACSHQAWSPGPSLPRNADAVRAKAQCDLWARNNTRGGGWAFGPALFVGAAALGNSVATGVRRGDDSDDCMLAAGWRRSGEDASPGPAPAAAPPARTAVSQPASVPAAPGVTSTTITAANGRARITLPPGWQPTSPPASAASLVTYALNRQIDAAVGVATLEREDAPDFERWVNSTLQRDLSATLENVEKTDIEWTIIGGRRAARFTMTATAKASGLRMKFLLTAIQGDKRILRVSIWTRASAFDANEARFMEMAASAMEAGG